MKTENNPDSLFEYLSDCQTSSAGKNNNTGRWSWESVMLMFRNESDE